MPSFFESVDVRVWGRKKFRALSKGQPNGQTLWLFLLTGPHNRGLPGLFNLGAATIAETLEWQTGDVVETFRELSSGARPMAVADWPARVILLPQVFKYQPPQGPNNVKGWGRNFGLIPDSMLNGRWLMALWKCATEKGEAYRTAFVTTFGTAPEPPTERGAEGGPPLPSPIPTLNPIPNPTPKKRCPAPEADAGQHDDDRGPIVMTFPLIKRDGSHDIRQLDVDDWQELFTGIDVLQELRACLAWNIADSTRNKTSRGIRRHITGWLNRAQDRKGGRSTATGQIPTKHNVSERNKESLERVLSELGEDGGGSPRLGGGG